MKRKLWIVLALVTLIAVLWCGTAMASDDYAFTAQPTSNFRSRDTSFVISWETSFKPVRIYIEKHTKSDIVPIVDLTDPTALKSSMYWPIPIHKDEPDDNYYMYAYYGESASERIKSAAFHNDWEDVKFDIQPTCGYLWYFQEFQIHWKTSFTPKKAEFFTGNGIITVENPDEYTNIPLSSLGSRYSSSSMRAYYGDGDDDYIRASFEINWESVKFSKQPVVGINEEGDAFEVSWETTFVPETVNLWQTPAGSSGTQAIQNELDYSMSCELPFTQDADNVYYQIRANYNGSYGFTSNQFTKDFSLLKFTSQPTDGLAPYDGHCIIRWNTSFKPTRVEIGYMDIDLFVPQIEITDHLGKSMQYDFSYDDVRTRKMYIRAYYDELGHFRESNSFIVDKTMDYSFTSGPSGGTVEPGETLLLSWRTNFTPIYIMIIPYNEDGTRTTSIKAIESDFASSMSWEIPWDKVGDGLSTVVVRAYIDARSYIETSCKVRRAPLSFTWQPQGGMALPTSGKYYTAWETNFEPKYCRIERKNGESWTLIGTIYNRPKKAGYDFPVDLDSTQEFFTFRVIAVYSSSPLRFVTSREFDVENPQPVTLTLTWPGARTSDRVYTLRKGQRGSDVLSYLPTAPTDAYTVNGWYADAEFTTPFSLSQQIMADTVAYCKTTPKSYTVTFVTNGGSSIEPVTVDYYSLIQVDPPVRDEYLFMGWYEDANLTNYFAISWQHIIHDTTLYAKWIPDGIAINEANFPISGFRTRVSAFDTNGDTYLTRSEIENAASISVLVTSAWTNIRGIEYLTGLTSLEVKNHGLNNPDLSHNTELKTLNLSKGSQLTTLDLHANTKLTSADLSETGLTDVDATFLPYLYKLDLHGCSGLTRVGVKGGIHTLYLHGTGLASVDLSACTNLWMAYRYGEQTEHDTYIEYFYANNNARLSVDKSTTVYSVADSVEINEKKFPDEMFRAYVSDKFDKDHNGRLSPEEIAAARSISFAGTSLNQYWPVYTLQGIEYFTELQTLTVAEVGLTRADLSANTKLAYVYLNGNDLESLDVSMLSQLVILNVYQNPRLSELRLGTAPNLQQLMCYGTAITALDFSGAPPLAMAYLDDTPC